MWFMRRLRRMRGELYDAITQVLFEFDSHHKLFPRHMSDLVNINAKARTIYSDLIEVDLNVIKQFFSQKKQEFQSGKFQAFASGLMSGRQNVFAASALGSSGSTDGAPSFADVQSSLASSSTFYASSGLKSDYASINTGKAGGALGLLRLILPQKTLPLAKKGKAFFSIIYGAKRTSLRAIVILQIPALASLQQMDMAVH
jgi:hypothetical protein